MGTMAIVFEAPATSPPVEDTLLHAVRAEASLAQ
jgi:hypothetical protein